MWFFLTELVFSFTNQNSLQVICKWPYQSSYLHNSSKETEQRRWLKKTLHIGYITLIVVTIVKNWVMNFTLKYNFISNFSLYSYWNSEANYLQFILFYDLWAMYNYYDINFHILMFGSILNICFVDYFPPIYFNKNFL